MLLMEEGNREDSRREGEGQTRKEGRKTSKMRTVWGPKKYNHFPFTLCAIHYMNYIF